MNKKDKKNYQFNWPVKYGFIGLNSFGWKNLTDGMNNEGLAANALWFPSVEYQKITDPYKGLAANNVVSWILSSFSTCDEVIEAMNNKTVQVNSSVENEDGSKFDVPLHYAVHDRSGKSIVIEFKYGIAIITDNSDIGVMTNDPNIQWQRTNLRNYVAITPYDTPIREGNNFRLEQNGHGNGFAQIPGSPTPPDRFVRAAMMTNYAYEVYNMDDATSLAFHIINTVDIPKGTNRFLDENENEVSDYPQWVCTEDLDRGIFTVRFYDSQLSYSIDLNKVDLENLNGKLVPIPQDKFSIDFTADVNKLTEKPVATYLNNEVKSKIFTVQNQ